MLTLGFDTSNYATSLAVFDTDAKEVVCAKKEFLPVKEGQRGLRLAGAARYVIQIAGRVRLFKINGRWNYAPV